MSAFSYVGKVPASKSLFNRALITQSYSNSLQILGQSNADDVLAMKMGMNSLFNRLPVDCKSGGTVLRFLTVRAARENGEFVFKGSERLFTRLKGDLERLLLQLGCEVQWDSQKLIVRSEGWKPQGDAIHVPSDGSSQFASALLLNCWRLPQGLHFSVKKELASQGYWQMTLKLMELMGMDVESKNHLDYYVAPHQEVETKHYVVEPDMSSAFTLASCAALAGDVQLTPLPRLSLQPDREFVEILRKMGADIQQSDTELKIKKTTELKAVEVSLTDTPDLFPVLATLCAFASGTSKLLGAPHLVHKESDRIVKTAELLTLMKVQYEQKQDGMIIHGPCQQRTSFDFDPDLDHRMAMAAGVAKCGGFDVKVKDPKVVDKSFPDFWRVVGMTA